ncbi:MAG: DUF1707 SHOCT-like domain-containing protein [Nocardioidaceae bacterium]
MSAASSEPVWARLTHDPRDPAVARLRASDHDRDVVSQVLAEAYADGRLDREEYDDRARAVLSAKLLGDLPPLVADLVRTDGTAPDRVLHLSSAELDDEADRAWHRHARRLVNRWASVSTLTTGIWGASSLAQQQFEYFWPAFPIVVLGVPVVMTVVNRKDHVEEEREKIRKKARKQQLKAEQARRAQPPDRPPSPGLDGTVDDP